MILEVTKLLLNQTWSEKLLRKNVTGSKLKKFTLAMIQGNWTLCTTILTLCFASILLGIYSTKRAVPLVQSLDDICDNKDIQIGGWNALNELNKSGYSHYFTMLKNRLITEKNCRDDIYENFILCDDIVSGVERGKVVILARSKLARKLKRLSNFIVLKEKYVQTYQVYTLSKKFLYEAEIGWG